jgi:alpha-glucoside transport system permease protein
MSVEAHEFLPAVSPTPPPVRRIGPRRLTSPGATIVVVAITVLWTIPTFGLLVTSLRTRYDALSSGWWTFVTDPHFTLDNYRVVLTGGDTFAGGITPYFFNSFAVAIPAAVFPAVLACMAAYALAWIPFRGAGVVLFVIVALQIVPIQVALLPLLQMFFNGWSLGPIPLFPNLDNASTGQSLLFGTYVPLWIAHTMFALPFAIFLMYNYISRLPREIFDAARVDGASHYLIFRRMVAPLALPAIAAFTIYQFLWVWNDLIVAVTLAPGGPDVAPITAYLAAIKGGFGQQEHLLSAGAFIAMVVPLVVFFALQRFFSRGLLAGAVDG